MSNSRMRHYWTLYVGVVISSLIGCASTSQTEGSFQKERNTLAITQLSVIVERRPILTVVRDSVDGKWFFFTDENPGVDPEVTLTLQDIIKIDASVAQLQDLPVGWKATRTQATQPWTRRKL
jgi:hypothetical protein